MKPHACYKMESQELLENIKKQMGAITCRAVKVKVKSETRECGTKKNSTKIPKPVRDYDYEWVCSAN